MSRGLTLNVNYENSMQLIARQLNEGGPLTYQESSSDYTHLTSVYQLPFGHNQTFLKHTSGLVDQLIGSFAVNTIYTYLSGAPLSHGETREAATIHCSQMEQATIRRFISRRGLTIASRNRFHSAT
jgi:hypothetical protein